MSEEPQVLKLGLSILIVLFELGLSKTPTEEHDRIPSSLNTLQHSAVHSLQSRNTHCALLDDD